MRVGQRAWTQLGVLRIPLYPLEDLNVGFLELAEQPFPEWGGDLSEWEDE
jgi:hypothetical protein